MDHIILIGFMGAGKTTIGKKLARRLGCSFVDTDELVVSREGRTIPQIFEESGEACFRRLETQALESLLEREDRCVVSAGGGLAIQEVNRPILKKLGTTIFLTAEPSTLMMRLKNDTSRPLLQGGDLRQKINDMMAARLKYYREAADAEVSTDRKSYGAIQKEIIAIVGR